MFTFIRIQNNYMCIHTYVYTATDICTLLHKSVGVGEKESLKGSEEERERGREKKKKDKNER